MPNDPRGPTAWQIEQSLAAFQKARLAIADDQLSDDENTIVSELHMSGVTHPAELIDRALDAFTFAKLRSDEARAMQRAWHERAQRYDSRADILRQLISDLMDVTGITKRQSRHASVSTRKVAPGVVILDAERLPDGFVSIVTSRIPDKQAIRDALVEGEVVEGATMSNEATTIAIKRHVKPAEDE